MNLAEYERSGREQYSDFASVVALILRAALSADESLRLQLVAHRAKDVSSLTKKLVNKQQDKTETLESDIKDLAGCRIVFYTNSDVARFAQSRIVHENFHVLEVKVHEPDIQIKVANELYQSNHLIVTLKDDRTALPEYSRFRGMRCEIQVQTILNHSWAQMAHDTIYKSPKLDGFGGHALEAVERRLSKVMTKHLLPAGYEFDKIDADFARLMAGKALFDEKALEVISNSKDNNERSEAIETFATNVLPLYDDLSAEYRGILAVLVKAVKKARDTAPAPRESYFGSLPPVTSSDIAKTVADIITRYRYVNIGLTLEALLDLFATARSDDERGDLRKAGEHLAEHLMEAWEHVGPGVQIELVDRISALEPTYAQAVAPLLTTMLGEVLKSEVSGTTSDSRSVTFHTGAVIISPDLLAMRHKATRVLKGLFGDTKVEPEQRSIISAMGEAARSPYNANYSNALAVENAHAAADLLRFQRGHLHEMLHQLVESLEDRALRFFRTYSALPKAFKDDDDIAAAAADVVAAAIEFRDAVNADPDFVIFKTLVGFESIFPQAWEDEGFQWAQAEAYRTQKVEDYVGSVTPETAGEWFERLSRYAATESRDLATFPMFGTFLSRLGQTKPAIVIGYLQDMGKELGQFAHRMIDGVMKSDDAEGLKLVSGWIEAGTNLPAIARYLTHADPFDPLLLERITKKAIAGEDMVTLKSVVAAAERQFRKGKAEVLESAFIPALSFFYERGDLSWVDQFVPWLGSPIIEALGEEDARQMLEALVPYTELENNPEYLVAGIAKNWPGAVLEYLGMRLALADVKNAEAGEKRRWYQPLPYSMHQLRGPLQAQPRALLESARDWFAEGPHLFRFRGGHLVATVFRKAEDQLVTSLAPYIASGDVDDAEFAIDILHCLEGHDAVFAPIREIVAKFTAESEVHIAAESALRSSGVLTGEFGSAEMLEQRKQKVAEWLNDEREPVREFAAEFIRRADLSIASERRNARARIAQRRLDHGEEPDPLGDGGEE